MGRYEDYFERIDRYQREAEQIIDRYERAFDPADIEITTRESEMYDNYDNYGEDE